MGVGNLQRIATFLLDGGRRPGTPVACVQHAGTPRQQVAGCPLADLAASEVSRRIHSPAVVVIGPTVPVLLSETSRSAARIERRFGVEIARPAPTSPVRRGKGA
jgi:siroheme synthase